MTKKLISNAGGMKTYIEIRDVDTPAGLKFFRVSTVYDGARNPTEERTKFDMCLDQESYQALKELINEM